MSFFRVYDCFVSIPAVLSSKASFVLLFKVPDNLQIGDFSSTKLPVILTPVVKRYIDHFSPWLMSNDSKQPFIVAGPEGCGKQYVFIKLNQLFKISTLQEITRNHG